MASLLLYCYPHYGLIDNNFDLIKKIHAQYSLNEFVIAIPSSSILLPLLHNSSLQRQLSELNPSLLVCLFNSVWVKFSLSQFILIQKFLPFVKTLSFVETRMSLHLMRMNIKNLIKSFRDLTLGFCFARSPSDVFISDITQYEKEHVREFFDLLRATSIISIPHGVSLPANGDSTAKYISSKPSILWLVYIHTHLWLTSFREKYHLNSSHLVVCGIPKHWSLSSPKSTKFPEHSSLQVVLCSRPYTKRHYLLKSQKKTYLTEIKQLVLDAGHSLIVKLHPGESDLDIFTDCLGVPSCFNNWSITDQSTSDIAAEADMCILFYSGTCVDFVVRGIPCIERSNLEECPASTSSTFFKGRGSQLVSPYAHYGLVSHAYDIDSFAELVLSCKSDTQSIAMPQFKAYQACFPRALS